jgi:serine/threonine protein kinase
MPLDMSKPNLQQIGNYDVISKIAEGGMGAVYKGRHRESGQIVAIKVLPASTGRNPVLVERFKQEFNAASKLDHPNVVKAIEYCGTGPTPFLVMEFVDGESLGQRIERDGAIPEEAAIRIVAQVCQGLHRAHKHHLIHRDVKPDNIMVTTEGTSKLMDLGLVKDADNELNLTKTGRGLGTPHFMAPEQFRNAKNADIRCDIYSLGATLYMMLTGVVPFGKVGPLDCWMKKIRNDFVPPREVNPAISERVDWAIRRAMSGDPDQRPSSCREFVEDLTGVTIRSPSVLSDQSTQGNIWYLVYKDEDNETHTVKGTTEGIRRALKEGLLGDAMNIRVCQTKSGPFQPLRGFPEYRDLVVEPAPMPSSSAQVSAGTHPTPTSRNKGTAPSPVSGRFKNPPAARQRAPRSDPDMVDLNSPRGGKRNSVNLSDDATTEQKVHIVMPKSKNRAEQTEATSWVFWVILVLIAVLTAFAGIVLLPKLRI